MGREHSGPYSEDAWRVLLHRDGNALHFGPRALRDGVDPGLVLFAGAAFDELILGGWLHVEQMGRRDWWLRLGERTCTVRERKDGTVRVRWDDQ